jgi:ribosomal protein L11 methyltransferase
VPDWSEAPDPDAVNVVLTPGVAFGTGDHATTRMCLRWLYSHPKLQVWAPLERYLRPRP